ncbi:hypothetical protein BJI47_23210 [Rhodococcus sp. 1168]|nr:hypothetical protein BJI47_23210 [Rhodococcus sp. 1168]
MRSDAQGEGNLAKVPANVNQRFFTYLSASRAISETLPAVTATTNEKSVYEPDTSIQTIANTLATNISQSVFDQLSKNIPLFALPAGSSISSSYGLI